MLLILYLKKCFKIIRYGTVGSNIYTIRVNNIKEKKFSFILRYFYIKITILVHLTKTCRDETYFYFSFSYRFVYHFFLLFMLVFF